MTGIAQAGDFAYQKLVEYAEPVEIGTQASFDSLSYKDGNVPRVAYMPPATEFNYYIAIGEGVKASAEKMGVDTFMLAPFMGNFWDCRLCFTISSCSTRRRRSL